MSRYDAVRKMLDAVKQDNSPYFNFASSDCCVIGRACAIGAIKASYPSESWLQGVVDQLGITRSQVKEIYWGYINLDFSKRYDLAYCLNYCYALIETWEAIDAASTDALEPLVEYVA